MSDKHIEILEDRKWTLENSFGYGGFHDGFVAQKIKEINQQIAAARAAVPAGDHDD